MCVCFALEQEVACFALGTFTCKVELESAGAPSFLSHADFVIVSDPSVLVRTLGASCSEMMQSATVCAQAAARIIGLSSFA